MSHKWVRDLRSNAYRELYHLSHLADYSASKAALVNLNESLRYELDKLYVSHLAEWILTSTSDGFSQVQDARNPGELKRFSRGSRLG